MTEKEIYRNFLLRFTELIDFYRIETGETAIGIPDVYYTGKIKNYKAGWIELKVGKQHKDWKIEIKYRPGQYNFLNKHIEKGLKAFTLIFFNDTYYLTKKIFSFYNNEEDLKNNSLWFSKAESVYKTNYFDFISLLCN
jgi:hypothetical protein